MGPLRKNIICAQLPQINGSRAGGIGDRLKVLVHQRIASFDGIDFVKSPSEGKSGLKTIVFGDIPAFYKIHSIDGKPRFRKSFLIPEDGVRPLLGIIRVPETTRE